MPELPEVKLIKIQLKRFLIGHKIERTEIRYKKCFEGASAKIKGGKVKDVRRFGKVVVIDLNNDHSLVIHVKLTGQLIYRGPNLSPAPALSDKVSGGLGGKHTQVIFYLDKDGKLFYNDFRKFGYIKVVKTEEVEEIPFIAKLGPEPLTTLDWKKFYEITKTTKRAIKVLLMDQGKISGIGNIYAIDALWLAQIHPQKKSSELSAEEVKRLYKAIETVLGRGLEYGGASELSFVTPDGTEGEYQQHFLAYGKKGQMCTRCGKASFKFVKISGRGTVFCPVCQQQL